MLQAKSNVMERTGTRVAQYKHCNSRNAKDAFCFSISRFIRRQLQNKMASDYPAYQRRKQRLVAINREQYTCSADMNSSPIANSGN